MVVVGEALVIGILCMALILIFRDSFSIIFTSDTTLQRAVARIAGLLGLTMVLNSVQPVVSGVAVGGGWQGLVAYINLGCYYIFGLPLGYLLGYKFSFGVGVIKLSQLHAVCSQKSCRMNETRIISQRKILVVNYYIPSHFSFIAGDLVRHALWYHPSDAHLARCGLEDRLESRGKQPTSVMFFCFFLLSLTIP
jgi:hypothetical protein